MVQQGSQLEEVRELVDHDDFEAWEQGLRPFKCCVCDLSAEDLLGLISTRPTLPGNPGHQVPEIPSKSAFPFLLEHCLSSFLLDPSSLPHELLCSLPFLGGMGSPVCGYVGG